MGPLGMALRGKSSNAGECCGAMVRMFAHRVSQMSALMYGAHFISESVLFLLCLLAV